jgi:protocatechuate 3,4-dioxygenase, beta subunit
MKHPFLFASRRAFLRRAGLAAAFFTVPGLYAEQLTQTPKQTEGPFYPDKLPLDTDNDLLLINDSLTPSAGEVTYLSGRILGPDGSPIRDAMVEIWQCDASGVYLHSRSGGEVEKKDKNFQGFGKFLTGEKGEYLFRTIKPVPYPGRTPHIHFAVKMKGREKWTTQCYIKGHAGNERDGIWRSIKDEKQRDNITVDFAPMPGARAGELAAKFDIIMGYTPKA